MPGGFSLGFDLCQERTGLARVLEPFALKQHITVGVAEFEIELAVFLPILFEDWERYCSQIGDRSYLSKSEQRK